MHVTIIQSILVIIFGFFMNYERWVSAIGLWQALLCGVITGLLCGDVTTGLYVGGTLQLMTLGVSSFGGASVPDYPAAAIVGTYLAIVTGIGGKVGVTIGIPVAIVMVQLDVLLKMVNVYFQHQAEKAVGNRKYKMIGIWHWIAIILTMCETGIPILLTVIFGRGLVVTAFQYVPQWLLSGLQVAGGLLPAVGLGILLRTMPVKKQWPALLIGFLLVAYIKVSVLGVGLFGVAAAFVYYKSKHRVTTHNTKAPTASIKGGNGEEISGDE